MKKTDESGRVVMVIGRVAKDPEIRFAGASLTPTATLDLIVERRWKDAKGEERMEELRIDVETWGRQAEMAVQHLRAGQMVGVEGRLVLDEWIENGFHNPKRLSKPKIVTEKVIYIPQEKQEVDHACGDFRRR